MSNSSGLSQYLLVVVRGADVDGDERARGNDMPSTSVSRVAVRMMPMQRRLPAQAFLDRLRHERAVGAQRVELVGVRQQAEQAGSLDER